MPKPKITNPLLPRPVGLTFDKTHLICELEDGRRLRVRLNAYPSLRKASPAQRADWRLITPEYYFHWPSLDLEITVAGLMRESPQILAAGKLR